MTSADVLRKLQKHFNPSKLFKPWLEAERERLSHDPSYQKKRKRLTKKLNEVKMGHGGTLDPLATGILIAGIGKGTKVLSEFLGCTKSYETVVVFGAETDSYDCLGKIVRRTPYDHITREKVEEALGQFRGKIMQRPPIFSALRVEGKKLYEYARAGKVPPVEIKSRPVETVSLELVDWYESGTHDFKWPEVEMTGDEKTVAEKLLDKDNSLPITTAADEETAKQEPETSNKRKSPPAAESPKEEGQETAKKQKAEDGEAQPVVSEPEIAEAPATEPEQTRPQPPAVRIKMTVTSGFYVRSLAHDLGKALGSSGFMASLVRSRQGDYELDSDKVLEYKDLEAGEEVWGPKVSRFLSEWEEKRAAKAAAEADK